MLLYCAVLVTGCYHPEPPEGMVYFSSGSIQIGSEDGQPNESPTFRAHVDEFFIDKHPVTVGEFRAFIEETRYITEAEKFGNSALFNFSKSKYELIDGVTWEYPLGRANGKAKGDHPVTHVSWNDARVYAQWAGKRLPTEIEWEYAAKGGKNTEDRYSWGTQLTSPKGEFNANVWQGKFPYENTVNDNYKYTSPVGAFGITTCGLTDMGGNVWEWCVDTYKPYGVNSQSLSLNADLKVIRGGSFMCDSLVCHGYRVTARQFTSKETSNFHMGFRCAQDVSH